MHHTRPNYEALLHNLLVGSLLVVAACGGGETPDPAAPSTGTVTPSSTGSAGTPAASGAAGKPAVTTMAMAGSAAKPPAQMTPPAGNTTPNTGNTSAAGSPAPSTDMTGTTDPGASNSGQTDMMASAGDAAPPTAGSDAPTVSAEGFPRLDEEVNIKAKGPYKVTRYEEGLVASEYASAVMYYPEDARPPFAAVALSPGFTAYGTDYEFVGDMLASHGIAALLTTPTTTGDLPPQRGDDLAAAVKHIQEENTRMGSPLMGKIATDRICITGHSMGGGGSLFGANMLGTSIRCVVPLQPWQPGGTFSMVQAPTLIVGATSDTIASVSGNASGHYASIPDSTEKILVVIQGDHYLSTDRTSGISASEMAVANDNYDDQAAYMIPFYKLHLEDDERYRKFLYGPERSMTNVTDFRANKM